MEELEDEDVLEEGRRGGFAFEELAHSTSRMSSQKAPTVSNFQCSNLEQICKMLLAALVPNFSTVQVISLDITC